MTSGLIDFGASMPPIVAGDGAILSGAHGRTLGIASKLYCWRDGSPMPYVGPAAGGCWLSYLVALRYAVLPRQLSVKGTMQESFTPAMTQP